MTLDEKLKSLSAEEIKEQLGIIYLCPMSCLVVAKHTGRIPEVGWYREVAIMESGSEWEGPYDTAQEALGEHHKH